MFYLKDRVVEFNQLKCSSIDEDTDKFQAYLYNLCFSCDLENMTMTEYSDYVFKYMEDNKISPKRYFMIQKKLMERHGMDPKILDMQLSVLGIDLGDEKDDLDCIGFEVIKKYIAFNEKYKDKLFIKNVMNYHMKNEKNDLSITMDRENIILFSKNKIYMDDKELEELLQLYKSIIKNNKVNIMICENASNYEY